MLCRLASGIARAEGEERSPTAVGRAGGDRRVGRGWGSGGGTGAGREGERIYKHGKLFLETEGRGRG